MAEYPLSTNVRTNITSYIGHNTTLPCWVPSNIPISAVEWTRREQTQYVYLNRDGHSDTEDQDPSYENRVKLKNRRLMDGDLSLSLKEVNPSDTGIFECRYKKSETRLRKRGFIDSDPISVVDLRVDSVQYIKAHPGDDVLLPCRAPRDAMIGALEWTRPDMESEGYVFLLRDGIPDPTNQHPFFENRVELQKDEDSDLSVVLKNVSISDTGTYECRYKDEDDARLEKRAAIKSDPVSIVKLKVTDSGHTDEDYDEEDKDEGHPHRHHGLIAASVLFVGVCVVFFSWFCLSLLMDVCCVF